MRSRYRQLCEWLEVSKSGYYEWRSRPQSTAAKRRELLKIKVKALFEANNEEYGYRRMHAALVRGGEQCCPSWSAASCVSWAWSHASRSPGGTR